MNEIKGKLGSEYTRLVARHKDQIFSFIYSLVHTTADAEDLFQETCLVLWEKFEQFEPGTDFVAWACTTAQFKVLNFMRRKSRDRHFFSMEFITQLCEMQADQSELLDARSQALVDCVQKLPEKDRQLVELCYGGTESIKQVAKRIDRTAGSVYESLRRIRRVLFSCVNRNVATDGLV